MTRAGSQAMAGVREDAVRGAANSVRGADRLLVPLLAVALAFLPAACASGGPAAEPSVAAPSSGEGEYTRVIRPFDVLDLEGEAYEHPFLGGFTVPRPQFVDIDNDGTLDLFVHERVNELMYFENVGTPQEPRYEWRTDAWQDLRTGEWTRFVDIDDDGLIDLLAEELYSYIRIYRNEGTPEEPRMVLVPDSLRDDEGQAIFADRQNVPAIDDIDANGRLDLFLGRIDGTVARYQAIDRVGEHGLPRFRLVTERFEGIQVVGTIVLPTLHGANSMYFGDRTGSGVEDLYWGDFFEAGLLFIENRGSPTSPSLTTEPQPVLADGEPIITSGFNAPVLANVRDDELPDLFIGVLGGAYNPVQTSSDNFHHYLNDGSGNLSLATTRFLNGIDLGEEAVPALADFSGNGRIDLLVGNKIDPQAGNTGRLYWFENVGEMDDPRFQLRDTIDLAETYHYAPTPANLWGDELPGLALGTFTDGVLFFRNVGEPGDMRFELQEELTVQLTRGSQSAPALVDLDGNGLLDLVVGRSNGELSYYRNVGTPTDPRFELESDQWMGIRVGRRSHPTFTDLTGDGLPDLVLGREDPGAVVFRNVGTREEPDFEEDPSFQIPLHPFGAPAFADLTGDGVQELVAGSASGGLTYFELR